MMHCLHHIIEALQELRIMRARTGLMLVDIQEMLLRQGMKLIKL